MKKFFKKSGITVGVVLSLVLIALLIASVFGGGLHSFRDLLSPLDKLVNAGMDKLEHIYSYMYKFDRLEAENAELKAKIAEMEEQVRLSAESNAEVERLRTLLDLADEHEDYSFKEASLVSWTSSNWASSFTINKGTRAGINVGDCVITAEGFLIGRITEAGGSSAVVQTILDSASGVGAIVDRTGVTAVAEGSYSLMGENKLSLSFIDDFSGVVAGDTVMTSGKGGIYPSGLLIGTVDSVNLDSTGLSSSGIISPAADISALTEIFIITDYLAQD